MTTQPKAQITPETRVGDLLSAYPELEPVLIAQAPAFANLRNPVLRRTVGKVATLAQAARVGGVDVRTLVGTLRQAAGLAGVPPATTAGADDGPAVAPEWYREELVDARVDADAMLARGEHPLGEMNRLASQLRGTRIVVLESGFLPAPLIDAFRGRGYEVAAYEFAPGRFRTCLRQGNARGGDDRAISCAGGC